MTVIRVSYFPKKCIGNGACAVNDPLHFVVKGEKAQLVDGKKSGDEIVLDGVFDDVQLKNIVAAAASCPVNAIRVVDSAGKEVVSTALRESAAVQTVRAEYDDLKEFVMDQKGYFLIRIVPETNEIEVALCGERNVILKKVIGMKPLEIYQTCIKEGMISRLDHAAYLGRELQKAYIALQHGIKYVQDDELIF